MKTYKAQDRRVYDGCPCEDMNREMSHTESLEKRMKKADPTASITYFPMEGKYLVFINCYPIEDCYSHGVPKTLTGNFHEDKQEALIEAITILEGR